MENSRFIYKAEIICHKFKTLCAIPLPAKHPCRCLAERQTKRALRDASQTPNVFEATLFVKLYKLRKRGILLSLDQPLLKK